MLEWMQDEDVVMHLQSNFREKTIENCVTFIEQRDESNIHKAIVNEDDEYMGTVRLKNINEKDAEFAIAVRKKAMGKGYAAEGMKMIIRYGFEVLHLQRVYWCVSEENVRAVRFYDKNGYQRCNSGDLDTSRYDELKKEKNYYGI